MKKRRILCLLLALMLLLGTTAGAVWAEPDGETDAPAQSETDGAAADEGAEDASEAAEDAPLPAIRYQDYTALLAAGEYEAECDTALLIERKTGIVIYAKNADEQVYPASLTKIMTCLLVIELCAEQGRDLDQLVTVTGSAYDGMDDASSTAGLEPGDQISIRELLYCMMLESANEACNILAEELMGNTERFVERMNQRAHELGCANTHFVNTHGLHDPDQYTTAQDLAVITETALECELYPELFPDGIFYTICTADSYTVTAEKYSGKRSLASTNYLIRQAYPEYYYSKARGVKTGYTSAAGRCLISTAEEDKTKDKNLSLLGIVLGAKDDDYAADGLRYRSFVEMKKLFEYAFDNFTFATLLSKYKFMGEVDVNNAKGRTKVPVYIASDVTCLLMKGFDGEQVRHEWALDNGATRLEAPLEENQPVGVVTVYYGDVEIARVPLLTLYAVERESSGFQLPENTVHNVAKGIVWILLGLVSLIAVLLIVLIVRNLLIRRKRALEKRRKRAARRRQGEQRRTPQ